MFETWSDVQALARTIGLDLLNTPAGPAKVGFAIIVFYFVIFFFGGLVLGKLTPKKSEDGYFHLKTWLKQVLMVEMVPLLFLALGLIPFVFQLECIDNGGKLYGLDCIESTGRDCVSCPSFTAKDSDGIRWIVTLGNLYGLSVVWFQPFVAAVVVLAFFAGILWCFHWIIDKLADLVMMILGPPARFVLRQVKKIPIRI